MKVFFKKTANSLKDIKENPSLIRKKQIEEEARQIKMNVRQEFQKMENNKICDVESEAAQKFGLISEFDIINHLNDQKQQQLVELKRIQVELVEENKQKIRPKSRQNWNGQNTFNLTALQSQSVQRPSTSYQTKTQLYSKNSSIPEYFSVGLVKNHNAVEQRLEDIKGRYEAVNEEIFKEQQKQLEIVKMQDELNDKDKRLREKLLMLKRMLKLAESRYINVERIEFHAAENKKHIKRNVQDAKDQLQQTQQIEEAFLEKKKQTHKELKREIVLQEDLLQHNYIKLQEKKLEIEEVKKELDQVICEEKDRVERENDFYMVGQKIWVLENLIKITETAKQGQYESIREIIDFNQFNSNTQSLIPTPQGNKKTFKFDSPSRSKVVSTQNIQNNQRQQIKLSQRLLEDASQQNFQFQTALSPPKLNRKEILEQLDQFFQKYNNIQEIVEMLLKEYHSIDLENQMKEIMYKTEIQQKMNLTQELKQLDSQLQEIKLKNEFIEEIEEYNNEQSDKNNIITDLLEQEIAMDAGRMVIHSTSLQELPSNVHLTSQKQIQTPTYQTVNQTMFKTEESQRLEMYEKKVKRIQSFLVLLFLSAKEYITRVICIVQTLQEKCSDKFSSNINTVLKEISQLILGKLPNQLMPKSEKIASNYSLIFENVATQRSMVKSQQSINFDEQIEAQIKMKSSLNSLSHIEDLELIDVISEIQDEKLKQLCQDFLENIKKSSLLKYFVQTNVISNQLRRLTQLYKTNPEIAIKKFSQFEELKQAAQLQIRIRFRQILDGFTRLYQQVDKCKEEGSQQIKLMRQYFSLNTSLNAESQKDKKKSVSIDKSNDKKNVRFMHKILVDQHEVDHQLKQKQNNQKVIEKIKAYQNSTEDDYYQKFGKMDMQNEQKRVHQEMIETEQEQKSKAIMKIIAQISEKKNSSQNKNQQFNEINKVENSKMNDTTADDTDYVNLQRQSIKQLEIDIKNNANKKKVKKKGFYSKELGFNSKPIEVFDRISKTYDKHQIEENKNVKQVAAESSILFKIDQLDSRYSGLEDKKITQDFLKEKRDRITFYKKEFQQSSQGYLKLNSVYHQRRQINSETIQNLKSIEYEKNLFLNSNDTLKMRPSTSATNFQSYSQLSSIYSKKSDTQSKQNSFSRKKLNAVLIAQQLNEKLVKQGVLKGNSDTPYFESVSSKGMTDTKLIDSFSRSEMQSGGSSRQRDEKMDYYLGKLRASDYVNEDRQQYLSTNVTNNK